MSAHKDRDKERPADTNPPEGEAPQERYVLQSQEPTLDEVAKLIAEKQELMDTLVRRQADFDNYRKRIERERQQDRHRGVELLIEQILPALDAFDRAMVGHDDAASAEYRKGFDLIRRQLWDVLAKQGLARIESVGQAFNPNFHHAIESVQTSDYAEGTVIDEMQPGYLFKERVLRPAMVRVAAVPERKSTHASRDN